MKVLHLILFELQQVFLLMLKATVKRIQYAIRRIGIDHVAHSTDAIEVAIKSFKQTRKLSTITYPTYQRHICPQVSKTLVLHHPLSVPPTVIVTVFILFSGDHPF